jgi:hypothetical protein
MALTNAQKQARWRERNVVVLTDGAQWIAEKLIDMGDQAKLRRIAAFINDHLKHPERDPTERAIALGMVRLGGLNGHLTKTQALAKIAASRGRPPQTHSWRVEVTTKGGRRWGNGVRLATQAEAEAYSEAFARHDLAEHGYVTAEIMRCDDEPPANDITRKRTGGRPTLGFEDGQCVLLNWREIGT